jgi:hypothetical protein
MVVAAHAGEGRHLVLELEPVVGQPALEHHRGAAMATAAQEQPPPPDVEPTRVSALGHDHGWGPLQVQVFDQDRTAAGDSDGERAPLAGGALDQGQGLAGSWWIGEADEGEGSKLGQVLLEELDDPLGRHHHGEELGREVGADLGFGQAGGRSGQPGQLPGQLPAHRGVGEDGFGAGLEPVGVDLFAVVGLLVARGPCTGGGCGAGGGQRHQQQRGGVLQVVSDSMTTPSLEGGRAPLAGAAAPGDRDQVMSRRTTRRVPTSAKASA